MRLLLVVDVFPPTRTSAAVQMRDLAATLGRMGHRCTVVTPDHRGGQPVEVGCDQRGHAPPRIDAQTIEAGAREQGAVGDSAMPAVSRVNAERSAPADAPNVAISASSRKPMDIDLQRDGAAQAEGREGQRESRSPIAYSYRGAGGRTGCPIFRHALRDRIVQSSSSAGCRDARASANPAGWDECFH